MHDGARVANVGIGTVSRVINENPGVRPATRQRVLHAIDILHYSPNLIARSLISRRTGSIGVIAPFFRRPFFVEIFQAVAAEIAQGGRELVFYNVDTPAQRDAYFHKLSEQNKLDGLLIISLLPDPPAVTLFQQSGMSVVLVDTYSPLLTSLVVDNVDGAYQAVKCLIEHGHRRIGFINGTIEGSFHFNQANDRLIGLHRALGEAGLLFEPELVLTTSWDHHGGRAAAWQLLNRPLRPTAIFAASDTQAAGVLEAAQALHITVPDELSLVGYDGIELSELLKLSTIQQPLQTLGELGVQKLIALIEHADEGTSVPELIRLQPTLVLRQTIARYPPLSATPLT